MEKQNDDILMKVRSTRACIGAGYRLYTHNFKSIFRYSWVAALLYGAICSFSGTLLVLAPRMMMLTVLLILIAEALFAAYGFSILKQHQTLGYIPKPAKWYNIDSHIFARTLKAYIYQLAIYLIAGAFVGGIAYGTFKLLSTYTALGSVFVMMLVCICLILPIVYVLFRYILNDTVGFWKQFRVNYGIGLHHWGSIFIVLFVAILVEIVLTAFTALPATILSFANMQANAGVMMGDPYGMPSYIAPLTAGTFLLIGFIQAYVQLTLLFPLYYLYGSIDMQEQERQELKKSQQQ